MAQYAVTKIADGLGFGTGSISHAGVTEMVLRAVEKVIVSDEVLIPIDSYEGKQLQDDGCGDGRPVARVFTGTKECPTSLNRAKIFGGGATMATAIVIGSRQAGGKPLREVFEIAMTLLTDRAMTFGGHTDDHASGDVSGCGAIDKAPLIIAATNLYRRQITAVISTLNIVVEGIDEVFDAFKAYEAVIADQPGYAGSDVIKAMQTRNKVVKELSGVHKEKFVILNMVPTMTVNQAKIREVSTGEAQAFGVDVWRLQQISEAFSEYGSKAFLAELIYTLATAAVLTAGDLPVYTVEVAS